MNKFLMTLKRFFQNKNTVTIICVLASIVVIYFGYNWRINQATKPVKVPYAVVDIQPRTLITEDMFDWVDIPSSMLKSNTIRTSSQIVGKYSNYNTVVPAGSLFYKSTIVDWGQMPDSAWSDIPQGYTVVSLPVDTESTLGNSIFPGNYIDLYYVANEKDGKLLLGKLIESIEVLSVKDSAGKYVFENSIDVGKPAYLLFAVPESLHLLLRKASYLSGEIIPVQRNKEYSLSPGETKVTSAVIQDFILSQTVALPDENLPTLNDNTPKQ
ncbi:MAG: hypothetical protein RR228_03875 [Bacilli bacterium]